MSRHHQKAKVDMKAVTVAHSVFQAVSMTGSAYFSNLKLNRIHFGNISSSFSPETLLAKPPNIIWFILFVESSLLIGWRSIRLTVSYSYHYCLVIIALFYHLGLAAIPNLQRQVLTFARNVPVYLEDMLWIGSPAPARWFQTLTRASLTNFSSQFWQARFHLRHSPSWLPEMKLTAKTVAWLEKLVKTCSTEVWNHWQVLGYQSINNPIYIF